MENKTQMRKNLTVPSLMYKLTRNKSDTDRLQVYDAIFDTQFGGKKLDYTKLSPIAETIVLALEIELNKMEIRFKNGCAKKRDISTGTFGCRKNESKRHANDKQSEANPETYYSNIISSNNNDGLTKSVSKSVPDASGDMIIKSNMFADELVELLKPVEAVAPANYARTIDCIKYILESDAPFRIGGHERRAIDIILEMSNSIRGLTLEELTNALQTIYDKIDAKNIKSKKYMVAALFNLYQAVPVREVQLNTRKKDYSQDFEQRDYTKEELNSVFDDLNSIEPL